MVTVGSGLPAVGGGGGCCCYLLFDDLFNDLPGYILWKRSPVECAVATDATAPFHSDLSS